MSGESKFEIVKAKVEAFCAVDSQYKINDVDPQKEAILIDGPDGALITMSLDNKGKVKCSDQTFQVAVMNLEEESGGYLPVPSQESEKKNIQCLVAKMPNLAMLSADGIRNFINPKATGQEIIDHLIIANELGLSPIRKEIYLIKRKDGTVSHVTGLNATGNECSQADLAKKWTVLGSRLRIIKEYTKEGLKAVEKGSDSTAFNLLETSKHKSLSEFADTKLEITGPDGSKVETTLEKFEEVAESVQKEVDGEVQT
jgi:hypothetical protein